MSRLIKLVSLISILILGFGLILWAPWLTPERAEALVTERFNSDWEGIIDGCGFACANCGAKPAQCLIIGYQVEIEYACGMLPADSPEYHEHGSAYVSPFGTVHGLSVP